MLFVQADRRLSAIVGLVEQPEKLPVVFQSQPASLTWAKPSFSISRLISSRAGNRLLEGGVLGRKRFSLGSLKVRMRVRISSHGRKSQLAAPATPQAAFPVMK